MATMRTLLGIAVFSMLFIPAVAFQQAEVKQNADSTAIIVEYANSAGIVFLKKQPARMPIDVWENLTFIQIRINGSDPVWFVFDSGATINVLDLALATRLGLDLSDTFKHEMSGQELTRAHRLTFAMPDLELTNQTALVMNLDPLMLFSGRRIDGIFGYELLRHAVVDIDYHEKIMTVHNPDTYVDAGTAQTLPLEIVGKWPVMSVRMEQEGHAAVENRLILDTGSLSAVSLMVGGLAERTINVPVTAGIGGVGAGDSRFGRIASLIVGPWTMRQPVVAFPAEGEEAHVDYLSKAIASTGIGIIGGPVLSRFRLIFDYPRKLIAMVPNQDSDAPFEFDMSGTILMSADLAFDAFEILAVLPDSPAATAGLEAHDIIFSVDGKSSADITLPQIRGLFKQEGVRYVLGIRRGEEKMETPLITRRLI